MQRIDGSFTNCDNEMVNILNDYFGTVFTVEDNGEVPSMGDSGVAKPGPTRALARASTHLALASEIDDDHMINLYSLQSMA